METLITFKTAQLAKDKEFGFDFDGTQYVPGFYSEDGQDFEEFEMQQEDAGRGDYYIRPSQSVLSKWLREVHNIDIQVTLVKAGYKEYKVEIYKVPENSNEYIYFFIKNKDGYIKKFNVWEEAMEEGLFETLNLI